MNKKEIIIDPQRIIKIIEAIDKAIDDTSLNPTTIEMILALMSMIYRRAKQEQSIITVIKCTKSENSYAG